MLSPYCAIRLRANPSHPKASSSSKSSTAWMSTTCGKPENTSTGSRASRSTNRSTTKSHTPIAARSPPPSPTGSTFTCFTRPSTARSDLANAQCDWLPGLGAAQGWQPVPSPEEAQALANAGNLVVAVYKEDDPKRHGHAAVIRPADKSRAQIESEGPQVAQAGMENFSNAPLATGFRHHPAPGKTAASASTPTPSTGTTSTMRQLGRKDRRRQPLKSN